MIETCGGLRVEHTPGAGLTLRHRPEPGYVAVAVVMLAAALAPWLSRAEFRATPLSAPDSLAVSIGSLVCLVAFGLVAVNDWRAATLPRAGGAVTLRHGLRSSALDGRDVAQARVVARSGRASATFTLVLVLRDGAEQAAFAFAARPGDPRADACAGLMRRALEDLGYARS